MALSSQDPLGSGMGPAFGHVIAHADSSAAKSLLFSPPLPVRGRGPPWVSPDVGLHCKWSVPSAQTMLSSQDLEGTGQPTGGLLNSGLSSMLSGLSQPPKQNALITELQ